MSLAIREPITCLPSDLDRSQLVDITPAFSAWRVFVDKVGNCHDSQDYYRQALAQEELRELNQLRALLRGRKHMPLFVGREFVLELPDGWGLHGGDSNHRIGSSFA